MEASIFAWLYIEQLHEACPNIWTCYSFSFLLLLLLRHHIFLACPCLPLISIFHAPPVGGVDVCEPCLPVGGDDWHGFGPQRPHQDRAAVGRSGTALELPAWETYHAPPRRLDGPAHGDGSGSGLTSRAETSPEDRQVELQTHINLSEHCITQKDTQPSQTSSGGFIKTQLYAICCRFFAIGEYIII